MDQDPTDNSDIPHKGSAHSPPTDIESPVPEADEKTIEVERQIHGFKWVLTVGAILSCVFLFALDTTVVCSKPDITIKALDPTY